VILGLEFGASREAASLAFAKRARPIKKLAKTNERAHEMLFDLTWALNQIDEAITNPDLSFEFYRVPADAGAFSPTGHGLFSPPPEVLGRKHDSADDDLVSLTDGAIRELLVVLEVMYSQTRPLPSL
jgi:hypothetical protein